MASEVNAANFFGSGHTCKVAFSLMPRSRPPSTALVRTLLYSVMLTSCALKVHCLHFIAVKFLIFHSFGPSTLRPLIDAIIEN